MNTFQHRRQYPLLPLIEHQGGMNARSRRLFPGSAQQSSWKNVELSKDRKTKGREDHLGFGGDESALDRKRDFLGCVERSSGRDGGRSMGSRCPLRRTGWLNPHEGAVGPTWEVERLWVMHLGDVEERFEIAWGDTSPGPWRVSAGSGDSCVVCRRDLVTRLDGGRALERAM